MATATNGTAPAAAPRRPATKTATKTAAPAAAAPASKTLADHLAVIADGDVMDPNALYEWLESLRATCTGLSFMVHAAASQLEAAARKGAKDSTDGRLTLRQKVELATTLRKMGKRLDQGAAEDLLACASSAVKTYALLETFLEGLESDTVARPHRSQRGGFNLGI